MMLKNFKLLMVLMLLIVSPGYCVKILKPGDVVKGKVVEETFYCLSEDENVSLLNKVDELKVKTELLILKGSQIKVLQERIDMLMTQLAAKNDLKDIMQTAYERARERETELAAIAKKTTEELERQKRRNKRMFGTGVAVGAVGVGGMAIGIFKEFK